MRALSLPHVEANDLPMSRCRKEVNGESIPTRSDVDNGKGQEQCFLDLPNQEVHYRNCRDWDIQCKQEAEQRWEIAVRQNKENNEANGIPNNWMVQTWNAAQQN